MIQCEMLKENFVKCENKATETVRVFSDEKEPRNFCKECAEKLRQAGLK